MSRKSRYPLPDGEGVQTKPLIFGQSPYDTERLDDMEYAHRQWDASYVPGYSEARAENEKRLREGKKPIPLPRLQWIRITRPTGREYVSETDEGMVEWTRLGYKACGVDDLRKYGYGWPPAAGAGPSSDGLIRRGGDLALFVIDEVRAERNRVIRRQELSEERSFVPASKTGEVFPLDEERTDLHGSLKETLDASTPL